MLTAVRDALEAIAGSLEEVAFVLPGPEQRDAETERREIAAAVRRYVLPRLREPDAPIVAVLVGLSGVGKSTLINTLAQDRVSDTGVVRPTTTHGVLWAHRAHAARYWTEFVGRVTEHIGATTDVVIGDDPLTSHVTFVDTPPLELVPAEAATTAADAVMFADICLFVSSVGRYADAAPFGLLHSARARGIPILFVLNRLPSADGERRELLADFAAKLADAGLLPEADPTMIFGVDESEDLRWHGGLGPPSVRALRQELGELSEPELRGAVIDGTAETTVQSVATRARAVSGRLRSQETERRELRNSVDEAYEAAGGRFHRRLSEGAYGSLALHEAWSQAVVEITGIVTRAAGAAADDVVRRWIASGRGNALIEPGFEGLRRHGAGVAADLRAAVDAWHDDLVPAARWWPARRRARRAADQLWRAVVEPGFEPKRIGRAVMHRVPGARAALVDAVGAVLAADAGRFHRRLGVPIDEAVLDRIEAASGYLLDLPVPEEMIEVVTNG